MSRPTRLAKLLASSRRPAALRRFGRARNGATVVEFALVAAPFFALVFALTEIGLVYFGNFMLENAIHNTARMIRTGQAQTQGFDEATFKEEVCGEVYGLFNCENGLKLDVRKFEKFEDIELPDPLDGKGELKDDFEFQMGDGGDIVVVRAFYEWGLIAAIPGIGLGNMGNGNRLVSATAAFRNEPFDNQ